MSMCIRMLYGCIVLQTANMGDGHIFVLCQQTILTKYHALFVIFEKAANLKLSSAATYRWRFMV